jgi:outer membrane protein assembly factor BamB
MRRHFIMTAAGFLLGLLAADGLQAAPLESSEWSRFRGPGGTGISAGGMPGELSLEKNLLWKAECGKGMSSPVISGERLFLTAFDGDERQVKCYSTGTGEVLWSKSVKKERVEAATQPGGPASSTPVADATSVYAFFPDAGLLCFDRDGNERWRVAVGPFHSFHGVAASLVLAENNVVLLVDQLQDSSMTAFNCQTGAEAWKVVREDGPIGGYSTPATRVTAQGRLELVVSGPLELVGYDAATGGRNWSVTGVTNAPISVPVVAGNRVFVCEPSFNANPFKIETLLGYDKNKDGVLSLEEVESHVPLSRIAKRVDTTWGNGDGKLSGDELDKAFESFVGGGGLAAIEIDETNGAARAAVKWTYRRSVPQIPSLLLIDKVLFFVSDGGILTSMNPENGEILKRARLNHGSNYYASPIAAAGRLLVIDTAGKAAITSTEAEWNVLSTSDLAEACHATPAVANGKLFVRCASHLFCFGPALDAAKT